MFLFVTRKKFKYSHTHLPRLTSLLKRKDGIPLDDNARNWVSDGGYILYSVSAVLCYFILTKIMVALQLLQ